MSLIKCSECGKEFSDKAPQCPNCGCPIDKIVLPSTNTFDDVFSANKMLVSLSRGAIKTARQSILPTEHVYFASILNISIVPVYGKLSDSFSAKGKICGVFVITNKRVLFVNSTLSIGSQKEILVKDITSIDARSTLLNCPIRIKGVTEMFVIDCDKSVQKEILSALSKAR